MVDGAFPVSAWAAGDRAAYEGMADSVERCPTPEVGRAEEYDARSIYSAGDVRWASVVADKEIQFAHQCCHSTERGFASKIERRTLYMR